MLLHHVYKVTVKSKSKTRKADWVRVITNELEKDIAKYEQYIESLNNSNKNNDSDPVPEQTQNGGSAAAATAD